MTGWLDWTTHDDLTASRGNGPFHGHCLGVVLHVNVDEHGTSDAFFAAGTGTNPDSVTPNFEVYKDGTTHQYLPVDWQPWCQADGNNTYAAIETAGMPNEPLTDAQVASCAKIMAAYRDQLGIPLSIADKPGQRGLGIHSMGGAAWGGHSCPGAIRANQRQQILDTASGKDWFAMATQQDLDAVIGKYFTGDDGKAHQLRTLVTDIVQAGLDKQTAAVIAAVNQHIDAVLGRITHDGDHKHPEALVHIEAGVKAIAAKVGATIQTGA